MKRILVSLLTVVLVLSMAACSSNATNDTMTIKLSHNQPESSSEHIAAKEFQKVLEEVSGGKMKVDIFPAQQLGSMREQAEGVQMGSHELTLQPTAVLTSFVEEYQIVDFPFLWPTEEKMWEVLDGEVGQEILAQGEAKGFKSFGFWGSGFKNFTTKETQITQPSDFEGLKIRVMPSELLIAQYEAFGAAPTPIDFSELYNALQLGTVQGQENPIGTIAQQKFYEVQDELILSKHGYLAYVFTSNKKWFDGLTEEQQGWVIKAEEAARKLQRTELKRLEAQFLEEIEASGINITELTEEGREKFFNASKSVHEEFANTDVKKSILNKIYEATK